jgi:hypothetical protein
MADETTPPPRDEHGHLPFMVHFITGEDGGAAYVAHITKLRAAGVNVQDTQTGRSAIPPAPLMKSEPPKTE